MFGSICLEVESRAKAKFRPNTFQKLFQNLDVNFGYRSDVIDTGNPYYLLQVQIG